MTHAAALLSRQPSCPVCEHEHHLLPCDRHRCSCTATPTPGAAYTTPEEPQ